MVDEEFRTLKIVELDWAIVNVVFSKQKLGFRVQEKPLESSTEEKLVEFKADKAESGKNKHSINIAQESIEKPCELVVQIINDDSLRASGLTVDCVVKAINGINLRGLTYSKQIGMLKETMKPFTITFLKKKFVEQIVFPSILKKLVANGENSVKSSFYDLVKGTTFGNELSKSENKNVIITELLSNQQRLKAVLQNTLIKETEL